MPLGRNNLLHLSKAIHLYTTGSSFQSDISYVLKQQLEANIYIAITACYRNNALLWQIYQKPLKHECHSTVQDNFTAHDSQTITIKHNSDVENHAMLGLNEGLWD